MTRLFRVAFKKAHENYETRPIVLVAANDPEEAVTNASEYLEKLNNVGGAPVPITMIEIEDWVEVGLDGAVRIGDSDDEWVLQNLMDMPIMELFNMPLLRKSKKS